MIDIKCRGCGYEVNTYCVCNTKCPKCSRNWSCLSDSKYVVDKVIYKERESEMTGVNIEEQIKKGNIYAYDYDGHRFRIKEETKDGLFTGECCHGDKKNFDRDSLVLKLT